MKSLIFGSTAARHWFPEFREPVDLDIISKSDIETRHVQHYHYGPSFDWILENNKDSRYVDADILANIKYAHLGFDVHFLKTVNDVIFFQKKGITLDHDLYKILRKDFAAFHGKRSKEASLKGKDSKSFFEDAVKRKYNHDSIHEAVAYYKEPLYYQILKNPETASVECSKEKFDSLNFDDKLKLIREELYVTALERWLIPQEFKYSKHRAYFQALKKLTTTMSSGWFKEFIIANFQHLVNNPDWEFIDKFNDGVKSGLVKLNNKDIED